jgi:hypothetical protein
VNGVINSVYGGVCSAVAAEFEDCAVYADKVDSGGNRPCFLVSYRPPAATETARQRITFSRVLGNRYKIGVNVCVQYYGVKTVTNSVLADVSERLFTALQTIDGGGKPVSAGKMFCDVNDGVLDFFAEYEFFAYLSETSDVMEEVDFEKIVIKKGE